jgi:hypothetical protein
MGDPMPPEPEPPKPEPPKPVTPQPPKGNGVKYAIVALVVLLLAGLGTWGYVKYGASSRVAENAGDKPQPPAVDWSKVNWDDPRLKDCKNDSGCVARRRWVDQVKGTDFKTVAKDAPMRRDCAGWNPCLTEFAPAVPPLGAPPVDWATVNWDDPRLNDCKNDAGCLDRRQLVEKVKGANFKNIARNASIRKTCAGWQPCLSEFPPDVHVSRGNGSSCTIAEARDLPATCAAGDKYCLDCKRAHDIPDGTEP